MHCLAKRSFAGKTADARRCSMWFSGFRRLVRPAPSGPSFADLRALSPAQLRAALQGPDSAALIAKAARYGLVEAQLLLGQMLLDGKDMPRDRQEAFAWFEAAAGSDTAGALNMLGRCHENGWGTPVDHPRAAVLFRRAAEAGHDWGQYNLGNALLRGQGVGRDRRLALVWFVRAARQGHAKSMNMVGRYLEEGWDMPADRKAASRWYRAAAERGCCRGRFNHATLLLQAGDIAAAAFWFAAALDDTNPDVAAAAATLESRNEPGLRAVGQRAIEVGIRNDANAPSQTRAEQG
jgi:TPR repeat protein